MYDYLSSLLFNSERIGGNAEPCSFHESLKCMYNNLIVKKCFFSRVLSVPSSNVTNLYQNNKEIQSFHVVVTTPYHCASV